MTVLPPLTDILDLEELEEGVFEAAPVDDGRNRVFGGQIVAQALASASFTVPGWPCHSLHSHFLRPGKPGRPIHYEVTELHAAKRFCTRQVVAIQREQAICQLTASFQADPGNIPSFQKPMPSVPSLAELPDEETQRGAWAQGAPEHLQRFFETVWPIEIVGAEDHPVFDAQVREPTRRVWFRSRDALPGYDNLHRCALAYASDMFVLQTCAMPLALSLFDPRLQAASLDHSIWFHRPFRADEWMLYWGECDSVAGGRGLGRGLVYTHDGTLIASVVQEGIMQLRD